MDIIEKVMLSKRLKPKGCGQGGWNVMKALETIAKAKPNCYLIPVCCFLQNGIRPNLAVVLGLYTNIWEVEFAELNWSLVSFASSEILQVLQVLDDQNVTYYSYHRSGM